MVLFPYFMDRSRRIFGNWKNSAKETKGKNVAGSRKYFEWDKVFQ